MNKCGTNAGYQQHCVNKTEKCEPCKNAHRSYLKEYTLNNKDVLLKKRKISYQKNSEKNKIARKLYYLDNSEKEKIYQRQYKKENPHLKRESERRRRAKRYQNGFELYKESQVIKLYGTKCYICLEEINFMAPRQAGVGGWEKALHIDHIVALSKGGPDTLENVRPSHAQCNLKKHANPLSL